MVDLKQKELFRLAAVLYSESNYEVNTKTIHRKIIESVFIDNKNKPISIQEVLSAIESDYNFVFSYEEVNEIITQSSEDNFLISSASTDRLLVCLTSKRKHLIESRLNQNSIDYFIGEFLNFHSEFETSDGKAIIYKFLYEVFSNNISSFAKLIDYKKDLNGAINIDDSFNVIEKQIINTFLQWDNDLKNKAIFDISSYALEYCLITNNQTNITFHLKNLKNKVFYLDTNIIFRAIGINGESRSTKTNTFLSKFKEAGETLVISSFTEAEYKATIKYYIDQIKNRKFSSVNPRVFGHFKKDSEFFDYYHKWRINRTNDSISYFETHMLSEYETFKKKFNVSEDYQIPFEEKNEDVNKEILELANDIYSFKNTERSGFLRYDTCVSDAKNIYLIQHKRNGKYRNIFETQFFFISSDQSLRRWDFKVSKSTPTVLLPSQWLSILLRYINRTNDDFKSFVSFLNLSQNESNITNEKLQLILVGISEITQDFEKQSSIVEVMIENKFKGILEKSNTEDEIIERSREFAKSQLEKDLDEISQQHQLLSESLAAHVEGVKAAFHDIEVEKQRDDEKNKIIALENRTLKKELRTKYVANKIFWWQFFAYCLIPILLIVILFYTLIFCCPDWKYNYSHKLMLWIDSLPKESMEHEMVKEWVITIFSLGSVGIIGNIIRIRLFDGSKKVQKITSIENAMPSKYL